MLIMFSSWSQGDTSPKMIYRTKPTYRRFTGLTTVFIDQKPTITGFLPTAYFSIRLWRTIKTLALLLHSSCANFAVDAQAKQEWYANLAGVWGIPVLLKSPTIKKGNNRKARGVPICCRKAAGSVPYTVNRSQKQETWLSGSNRKAQLFLLSINKAYSLYPL